MSYRTAIVGVGATSFGKFLDRSIRDLSEEAVRNALANAGVSAADVDRVYFGNAAGGLMTGQEMIRGQAALRFSGLAGTPLVNVENACATGSSAFHLAWEAIEAGQIDVAVVVGAEKLSHKDKSVSLSAFAGALDLEEELPSHIGTGSGAVTMDVYAEKTCLYMTMSGATQEDFAQVVVKSRKAGSLNPIAQFKTETSVAEVLAQRTISGPLKLPMCSAMSDGAAALVLCSSRQVSLMGHSSPVWVAGSVLVSGFADPSKSICAVRASKEVYDRAGIGPQDIQVIELHDAAAPAELIHYENLGLCAPGGGPDLLRSGITGINGRISVNPSGGLLSRGHPLAATGVAQMIELVHQLRGTAGARQREAAKVGLAENNGGQIGGDAAAAGAVVLCR
ncbi:thiolase [Bradyrhizobium genosp. SA-3]|uniref:thiolase family protein n=1 Tax=Bradyrhizobium genosp. SA-3 TaxID=508868 RepID=UPI0010293D67|nr:thiolase family protein [Bradyrhizobium genosp. SA-3]RZN03720.1 thiolase [Bradyrhizobium genosp. SA-3]